MAFDVPTISSLGPASLGIFTKFADDRFFVGSALAIASGTPVVDVSLFNATLRDTLIFTVSIIPDPAKDHMCGYWHEGRKTWDNHGMTTTVKDGFVSCTSTHLTNFAVLVVSHNLIVWFWFRISLSLSLVD